MGDTWYLDEVFVTIRDRRQYLWRAVDQDGDFSTFWSSRAAITEQRCASFVKD